MAKELTPEQREAKNRKQQESYAAGRQAGLSPKDAKSPRLVQAALSAIAEAAKAAAEAAQAAAELLKKNLIGVVEAPKQRKDTTGFLIYARQWLENDPTVSARKIKDQYRKDTGQSIANDTGDRIVRELKDAGKNYEKVRYIMFGKDDNPLGRKYLMPKRYMWFVEYEVEVEGQPEPYIQYTHVSSDSLLTPRQIVEAALRDFQIGQDIGKERYKAKRLLTETIRIIYGIDRYQTKSA